ncbi:TonB-dependent receptor [Novosphingobium sp. YJ-S2-02]|uniref:TonB-dependent receptor n=1 Tax=Novosphingobium aureum TaxID=2792964 RepID=A0A931HC64_9SPHN|nr:TonB-dependent receptor [Novosphingobium aureum]MBH0113352.1 TonB-dependent receptor [Novosphingobium aureum]
MKNGKIHGVATASTIALASVLALGFAQPALAQQSAPAAEQTGTSIVVTARKREETLLETPIAITALSAEEIEQRGIKSINDVVLNTPGINVSNTNSGRNDRSFQQISLRGMTPSTTSSTLTASFLDGVPVASATALMSITDPERIEVLKGPQNAYFGRNAFAGAINIVTKTPADEFGGAISAMVGTRDNFDISGALEGPLVDGVLGVRITGRSMSKSGSYVNQADPNQTLGDQKTDVGTIQFVFTPSSALTVKAMGMYSRDNDGPSAQGMVSAYELRSNNGAVNIPYFSGSNAGSVVVPGQANCMLNGLPYVCGAVPGLMAGPAQNTTSDALLGSILSDPTNRIDSNGIGTRGYGLRREYYHFHLGIDYELGDSGLTLSSLTGYNNEYYSELADLDNYDSVAFANSAAAFIPGVRDYWSFPYLVERRNKDFSQELRLTFEDGGPLHAMFGASYLDTDVDSGLVSVFNYETYGVSPNAGALSPPQQVKTIGVFGSAAYDFTDALTLSVEGRWQRDKVYAFAGGRGLTISDDAASNFNLPSGSFDPLTSFYAKTFSNFLPRVILNYDVSPDMMVYASWSKAVNVSVGSFNTSFLSGTQAEFEAGQSIGLGVIVQPEKLTNYEVGLKGSFLNGDLQVTSAFYLADWSNQHNTRSVFFVDPATDVVTIVTGVANSGKTRMTGFELDVLAEPFEGLSITASGAINSSSIRSFSDPAITLRTGLEGDEFRGNQLPLSSKYSANLGMMYTGQIPDWDNGSWFVRGDAGYKSKQYVDAGNLTWIKGRTQVNARVGFSYGDVTVEGFVTNLFKNKQYTSVAQNALLEPSFFLAAQSYGYLNLALPELRTWGIKAGYKF